MITRIFDVIADFTLLILIIPLICIMFLPLWYPALYLLLSGKTKKGENNGDPNRIR